MQSVANQDQQERESAIRNAEADQNRPQVAQAQNASPPTDQKPYITTRRSKDILVDKCVTTDTSGFNDKKRTFWFEYVVSEKGLRKDGEWVGQSWREVADQICLLAENLRGLGLKDGDRVCIVSENVFS